MSLKNALLSLGLGSLAVFLFVVVSGSSVPGTLAAVGGLLLALQSIGQMSGRLTRSLAGIGAGLAVLTAPWATILAILAIFVAFRRRPGLRAGARLAAIILALILVLWLARLGRPFNLTMLGLFLRSSPTVTIDVRRGLVEGQTTRDEVVSLLGQPDSVWNRDWLGTEWRYRVGSIGSTVTRPFRLRVEFGDQEEVVRWAFYSFDRKRVRSMQPRWVGWLLQRLNCSRNPELRKILAPGREMAKVRSELGGPARFVDGDRRIWEYDVAEPGAYLTPPFRLVVAFDAAKPHVVRQWHFEGEGGCT